MKFISKSTLLATASIAALTFNTSLAFAGAAGDAWQKLVDMAKENGTEITWQNLEEPDDTSIVVSDITIKSDQGPIPANISKLEASGVEIKDDEFYGFETLSISDLTGDGKDKKGQDISFSLKSASAKGLKLAMGKEFRADEANISDLNMKSSSDTEKPVEATLDSVSITGWYYPAPSNLDAPMIAYQDTNMTINNLSIKQGGVQLLELTNMEGGTQCDEEFVKCTGKAKLDNLFIMPPKDDPKVMAQLKEFGLEDGINASITVDSKMDLESGDLEVDQYDIGIEKLGDLNMTGKFSGMTPEFVKEYRKAMFDLSALQATQDQVKIQQANMKLLGLMTKLNLVNLSLRFNDDSLTNKVLEMQAKKMGSTSEELAMSVPMMASLGLAKLENPDFAKMASGAISTYMKDPKNITIAATPEKPVSIGDIMGSAMAAPAALLNTLNVSVTANQ